MYVGHLTDEELMLHCRNLSELTTLEQELFHRMDSLLTETYVLKSALDQLDTLFAQQSEVFDRLSEEEVR